MNFCLETFLFGEAVRMIVGNKFVTNRPVEHRLNCLL